MIRIKINDLPITCFNYDTDQSISERFSVMLQTLPQWIDPISVKSIKNGDEMKINVFKNDVNNGIKLYDKDFTKFIDSIKDRLYFGNISFDIILKYWLSELYKSKPFISNEYGMIDLELSLESYKSYIIDTFRKDKIYTFLDDFFKNEMKNFIKDIDTRIKKIKNRSESLTKKFDEIGKMPIIPYKDFAKENVAVKIKLPITRMEMSIQTVFANLECYQDTPFFTFDGMYKFYNDLEHPLPEWDSGLNAVIIGYIYTLDHSAPYEHTTSSYSRCFITYEEDDRLTIYIEISYKSFYNQKLYKDTILSRFFKCFEHNYKIYDNMEKIEIEDEQIVGIAIFPMLAFNTVVMSDMIMNNSLFSHFLVVDEREQASKEKSGLYTHFFIDSDEGKASIMTRIASNELQESKHIDRQSLPFGAPYIRVRITQSKNMAMIDRFLSIFSQLLGLYAKYEDKVIADYKSYGVTIDKNDDYDIQTSFSLSELNADLFHSKYTRSCGSDRQPVVISEEETKNYEPHQYLKFPATPDEGAQYIYSCSTNNKYIYAGLILNSSKTKDKYPYIPCCFSEDQINKKNSNLRAYLKKTEKNVKKIQQNIITTDKFANNNYHADLHPSLSDLFTILESSEYVKKQYKYLRLGVSDTRLSFLECVLKATFSDDSKYDLNEEYEKLLTYPFLSVVSQENPNETEKELYDKLKNTHYLDPRRWIRLLEEVYQCKIVVFTRDREKNDPVMMIPFHKINHLAYRSPYQTIVAIYEHFGGEATQLEDFPRCELIVAQKKENDNIVHNYFLNARTNLVDFQHHTYKQLYYHIPTKNLMPIHINYRYDDILNAFNVDSNNKNNKNNKNKNNYEQFIDSYGKTRAIIVNGISFFTSPLPPMALKTYYTPDLTVHHYADVKKYIEPHSILSINQIKNKEIEITFKVNVSDQNQVFTVKVDSCPLKKSSDQDQLYPSKDSNQITTFFDKKRLVVFLLEYFLYFYSSYCNSLNIRENLIKNTDVLQKFVKTKIVVNENNEYKIPTTPLVSMNQLLTHQFIDKNQNFIVDSKETKRRLVYALHIKLSTHFTQIYTYYMQSEINNFYVDTIHYNNYPSQSTVTNHIDIFDDIDRRIYETIQPSDKKYFFENKTISSRPMLLIEKEDREHAAEISYEWSQTARISDDDEKHGKYALKEDIYLYESSKKIKSYKAYDDGEYANSDILAYKKDNQVHYLAIAKL